MANHVSSYCRVKANEAGLARFKQIMSRLDLDDDPYEKSLGFIFWDSIDDFHGGDMVDRVGAKWAYATDIQEDAFGAYSAWNYIEVFYDYLSKEIGKVDSNATLIVNYEDEMPNFIGVSVFDCYGLQENVEIDSDELDQYIRDNDAEIAAEYDEDENEYSDLGEEYLSESKWDHISTWQHQTLLEVAGADYLY